MSRSRLTRRAVIASALALAGRAQAQTWVSFHDGLVARIPDGFEAHPHGTGVSIAQSATVRTPLTMLLRVNADAALHRTWFPNRRGDIRYTIANTGGTGSGGPVFELRAIRNADAPLQLIAQQQGEFRPDFEIALDLLSSVHRPAG